MSGEGESSRLGRTGERLVRFMTGQNQPSNLKTVSMLAAIFGGVAAVTSSVVIPVVLYYAGEMVDDKLERHHRDGHTGAPAIRELDTVRREIDAVRGRHRDDIQALQSHLDHRFDVLQSLVEAASRNR